MQGNVSILTSGSSDWAVATLNSSVTTGDRLVADDGGRAELEIGPLAVRFGSSTDVTVTNLTDGLLQLGVPAGTLRLSVYRMNAGDTIEVDTPNGAISVLTPGNYRIATNGAGTQTMVSVERGRVQLSGPGLSQDVDEGRTVRLSAGEGGMVQIANAPRPGPDGFDSWSAYRDGAIANPDSQSSAYVNPDIPGVQDLDANGRWENDAAYGPIWYPTVVASWAPYRYGHWGWVEPWGWVWIADEPWGFAPFHYGRWAFARNRWGWVPGPRMGRPYYAPALVAFADGAGFGVGIGVTAWFPLGPRDPFLPWYHHDDRYLRAVNRANVRGVADINVFVHVQDVEHFRYANRTTAMTVVPTRSFASGRPVARDVIRVAPERIAMARVAPHPGGVPAREAAIGGVIAPRPRAAVERVAVGPEPGPRRVAAADEDVRHAGPASAREPHSDSAGLAAVRDAAEGDRRTSRPAARTAADPESARRAGPPDRSAILRRCQGRFQKRLQRLLRKRRGKRRIARTRSRAEARRQGNQSARAGQRSTQFKARSSFRAHAAPSLARGCFPMLSRIATRLPPSALLAILVASTLAAQKPSLSAARLREMGDPRQLEHLAGRQVDGLRLPAQQR